MKLESILADSPAIIVGKRFSDFHGKLALVRCEKTGRSIIAAVVMSDSFNRSSEEEYEVSRYILRELECDQRDIEIEFFSDGLFVYGTLLPKYITPYGAVHKGWGGLSMYPWVRTIVQDFKLVYSGLPYAVRSESSHLLGVTYLGISDSLERYIDSVEIGAGYVKVEVEGQVVENFPIKPTLMVRMYTYEDAEGICVPSMLFGELFVVDDRRFSYHIDEYFDFLIGNSGILITVPHGGFYRPKNMKVRSGVEADENTFELAKLVVEKIYELSGYKIVPNAVLARIHRSIVDLNQDLLGTNSIARDYHETIELIASRLRKVFLVDIHGMASRPEWDIEIGTRYGRTVHGNIEIVANMRDTLKRYGFKVVIDEEFIGGFTINKHSANKNVYAIQIEINRESRMLKNIDRTAKALAESILTSYLTHMR